jgi:anti-anti-sigma factor
MSNVTVSENLSENEVILKLGKRFDFNIVDDFRTAYSSQSGSSKNYIVDFRETEYMDSSGLGMLLNMRRHLGDDQAKISLINCRPQIRKILTISRFDMKFRIT